MLLRIARPALVILLGLTLAATAWHLFRLDRQLDVRSATEASIARTFTGCREAMLDLRAVQRVYTAPDQDVRYWRGRASSNLIKLDACTEALAARAADSPAGHAALLKLRTAVAAVRRTDGRMADLAGTGLRDHAHDLLYGDAINGSVALERELAVAEASLVAADAGSAAAIRRQQVTTAGAAAGAAFLTALLLARLPRAGTGDAVEALPAPPAEADAEAVATRFGERAASPAALQAAADVCGALARVQQPLELAGLVERMHGVLDSRGTIVWVYDEAAGILRPGLSAGYPPGALGRMGTIALSSDTPVATAFTRGEARAVKGTADAPGALVVPIVAPGGVSGVVTIELPPGNDRQPATLALTRIFAAQIAGLLAGSARPANTEGPEIVMSAAAAKVIAGASDARERAAGRYSDLS